MPYTFRVNLGLGASKTGLTITAALFDDNMAPVAGLVSTITEATGHKGNYLAIHTVPTGATGGIQYLSGATEMAFVAVEPPVTEATIWSYATRTLTSLSALVASIATAVWTNATRTLTNPTVTSLPSVAAGTLVIRRGDTASLPLTGLGNITARTKLWLTIKRDQAQADAQSTVQVIETTGLTVLNGVPYGTPADGSVTVTDAVTGALTFGLAAGVTAALDVFPRYTYDVQMLAPAGVSTLATGICQVVADVTRATS